MKSELLNKKLFTAFVLFGVIASSCKKFVEVPPPSYQIGSDQVFADDATATAAVIGLYSEMMKTQNQFSAANTTLYAGMYADELIYYSPSDRDEFIASELSQSSHSMLSDRFWGPAYRYINTANICLEKLNKSTSLSPVIKNTLTGEAKFIRAFCFFHLVNLFGEVPLTITSDFRLNASLKRATVSEIYSQILEDLKAARQVLPAAYSGSERIRPNKWAAAALLARVYLYNKSWTEAEQEATSVISSGMYNLVSNLNNVFLKGSQEAIWQLQPVNTIWNTWEGNEILPETSSSQPTYLLRDGLLNAFEPGDQRKPAWVKTRTFLAQTLFYPYKYKVYGNNAPITEYYTVIRFSEQFLVRAEARANLGNLSGAIADLNMIRNRAGLPNTTASDLAAILNAIERERRVELFAEWGHRWFDLKRWGKATLILSALKPASWQDAHVLWPIPIDQLNANPFLKQNPGY